MNGQNNNNYNNGYPPPPPPNYSQGQYPPPPPNYPPQYPPVQNRNASHPNSAKGTASFVLGIISLVSIFFQTFFGAGIVCAIVGIVLGCKAKSTARLYGVYDSKASSGVIMSIIGLSIGVIYIMFWVFLLKLVFAVL